MSLQVWLPLTKDLRQQGLSNVTVTNNGATFDSVGKLGGCYSFDGTDDNLSYTPSVDGIETLSIAFWVCPTAATPAGSFFSLERNTYWQLTFYGDHVAIRDNSIGYSGTRKNFSTGTYIANTWTHVVVTYDKGTLKIYRDGSLLSTNSVGGTKLNTSINNARIGSAVQSGYYYSGKMNDVRIYDNCLSSMEIKQLAQGLVLHYPLNRGGFGQENLATCSTQQYNLSASTSNYNYFWINGGTLEPNTVYTFSAEVEVSDNVNSCTIFNYTSGDYTGTTTNSFPADGKRHSWTFTTSSTAIGLIAYAGIAGATANHTAIYKNIKIEKGTVATPYIPRSNETLYTTMGLNGTTEYDCSGFCNNGIRAGTFDWTSNTAKYAVSTKFNGTDNAIQTPSLPTMITDKNYTIAVWIYKTVIGSKGYQTIYGGPSGFEIEARNGSANETKFVPWNWGKPMASYELNEWNHCVFVHSDADCKIYLNGEYIATGTTKASNPTGNYFVGAWNTSTQQNFDGLMSDFRIYATALSADDVKSLYQNCATIDPDGTIRGQIRS